jgi:hypothetical protein
VEQLEGMLSLDIDMIFNFINISAKIYKFSIQLLLNTKIFLKHTVSILHHKLSLDQNLIVNL